MNAALQRRARGGLCGIAALVLVAALGGFAGLARPAAHGRSASAAELVPAHLVVASSQYMTRGAQHLIAFDIVGADRPIAPEHPTDAAAHPSHPTVTDAAQHPPRSRDPPAGELA